MQQDDLSTIELILSAIEQVVYKGGFAVFDMVDYYIQIATQGGRGAYEVLCEAVSNNCLEKDHLLNEEQQETLIKLGWNKPQDSEGNYYLIHSVDSETSRLELACLIFNTSTMVYFSEIDEIDIEVSNTFI